MRYLKKDTDAAREYLLSVLKPGDAVYTILRHVSASKMTRDISVVRIGNNKPENISIAVARLLDKSLAGDDSIRTRGTGMDMGFFLVYSLSQALWPPGSLFDGSGYALQQVWL